MSPPARVNATPAEEEEVIEEEIEEEEDVEEEEEVEEEDDVDEEEEEEVEEEEDVDEEEEEAEKEEDVDEEEEEVGKEEDVEEEEEVEKEDAVDEVVEEDVEEEEDADEQVLEEVGREEDAHEELEEEEKEEEEVEKEDVVDEVVEEEDVEEEEDADEQVLEEEEVEEEEDVDEVEEEEAVKVGTASSVSCLLQSVNDLQNLNGAISEFVRHWNGLQQSLDSIQALIEARSKKLDSPKEHKSELEFISRKPDYPKEHKSELEFICKKLDPPKEHQSELEFICRTMGSKALRKYVIWHLSDINRLRKEVPTAIRDAPNPAKLVLDSMGRFYLQGSKAYDRPDNPMVAFRRASILLLEFYILSGCCSLQTEPSIKEDARVAATAWKARLVVHGGFESASVVDVLGLILFIASFGIPPEFGCRDLYNLLQLSDLKKKADVLRLSPFLLEKIPDIINDMIAKDMHVEAVDLVYAFGLEEKFVPLPLLLSFCCRSMEKAYESVRSPKEADEKKLAALKSVVRCIEEHKLDPSLLGGFDLSKTIAKLENDIPKGLQKLKNGNAKRMAEEVGPLATRQAKRHRPAPAEASSQGTMIPHNLIKQQQQQQPHGGHGIDVHVPSPTVYQPPPVSSLGIRSGSSDPKNLYKFADTVL